MKKVWLPDNVYASLILIVSILLLVSLCSMVLEGVNAINVAFGVCLLAADAILLYFWMKVLKLAVKVNNYLFEHKCFEWVEEVTLVFKNSVLRAVTIDLTQYLLADVEGKYNVIYDDVDERVTVYRYQFFDDWDRVLIVVEYQGQVDVYTNILEDEDEE